MPCIHEKTPSGPINITFHEHNNPKFERNDPLYGCVLIPRSIPLPHKSIPAARTALLRGLLAPLAGGTALRGHDDEEGDSTFKHNALAEMETQPTRPHTLIRNPIDFNGHRLLKTYLRHTICTTKRPTVATCWTTKSNDGTF